jgi:hypothetical protein
MNKLGRAFTLYSAIGLVFACQSGREAVEPRGVFAAAVNSILASSPAPQCAPGRGGRTASPKPVRGCWTRVGDTLFFFYATRGDTITAIGREWQVPREEILATYDSLEAALTKAHGPGESCAYFDPRDVPKHRLWRHQGQVTTLLAEVPDPRIGLPPQLRLISEIEPASCRTVFTPVEA